MPGRGKQLFLSLLDLDGLQLNIIYMPKWHIVGLLTQNPSLFYQRQLQPMGQIQPTTCFGIYQEIRMVFKLFK